MDEITESINKKTSIMLSRNSPVALVVGSAGFLGSNLTEGLLDKGIQVVGVDNLKTGKKENLHKASANKHFHFVMEDAENLNLDLDRLDYIFIVTTGEWNLTSILDLFKSTKARLLLVSSIDLYENDNDKGILKWLKHSEGRLAKFAQEHKLNARVLRLGPVFGPRMHFREKDPLIKLIQRALTNELQKDISLEFSSRALYVDDAIDLIIRTIFAGSTAQKIFDGVSPGPVEIKEVKQVLLDPDWYANRDFVFSELPPWPTPNLSKTIKILNWRIKNKLIPNLKETINFFKDNDISVPEPKEEPQKVEEQEDWKKDKKATLELFKGEDVSRSQKTKNQKEKNPSKSFSFSGIYLSVLIFIVGYALIWPVLVFGWGTYTFQSQLNEGFKNLEKGGLEQGLQNIQEAGKGLDAAQSIADSLDPLRQTGYFNQQFEIGDNLFKIAGLSVESAKNTISGMQALFKSLKAVTGESNESPAPFFDSAQIELTAANEDLARSSAILNSSDFKKNLPDFLANRISVLSDKLTAYTKLVEKARAVSVLLPQLVGLDGTKNYLVLLQNNMELRPGGGFIGSFAKIAFEGGKLKKLEVNDIYAIDGQLSIHVEPPKEIKSDLNQVNWYLRDSNWEPDFPTAARQAEWFYTKETGDRVEGVIALDFSAMENLLEIVGPLDLADYNEKITPENLFERAVSHAELSFFAGSQAKKSFLTALTNGLFNKIFFLPQNNWPGIIAALGKSLDEKHMSVYLNDPQLFSYLAAQNWIHDLPRGSDQNKNQDFLSVVEANLGANKANYYLDRNYNLETVVGKDGEIKHKLRISYTNRSPSDTFPGGKYKDRMRVYLPFGAQLTKVTWGEADITKSVTGFVDYGRSGYSVLLELAPREQKNLVLDYTVPVKLDFKDGKATYRLDIIKEAGTLKDPLTWNISFPINYQVISNQTKMIGPQEQTIATDLSRDRSFLIEFTNAK